jgi:hypothetical protein
VQVGHLLVQPRSFVVHLGSTSVDRCVAIAYCRASSFDFGKFTFAHRHLAFSHGQGSVALLSGRVHLSVDRHALILPDQA